VIVINREPTITRSSITVEAKSCVPAGVIASDITQINLATFAKSAQAAPLAASMATTVHLAWTRKSSFAPLTVERAESSQVAAPRLTSPSP